MNGTSSKVSRYRFGPFELDAGEQTLSRNGIRVRLQDLPYRLLLMLVERPGEIITREEVRLRLWPENTFVEFDNSLGVAIRKVRESLHDNAEAPIYVATIPRRGYRFIAPVLMERPESAAEMASPAGAIPTPAANALPALQPHWGYWVAAGVVLLLGVAAVSFRFHFKPPYVSTNADSSVVRASSGGRGARGMPFVKSPVTPSGPMTRSRRTGSMSLSA